MSLGLRSSSLFGAFIFCGVGVALISPAGCETAITTGTGGQSVTNSAGSTYHPACNGGVQDGFCNAYGADPETCACLDCTDTAFCKGGCKDDGVCNFNQGEDCTCIDCFGKTFDDGNGNQTQCPTADDGPGETVGPSTNAATTGSSGGAGTTAAATTGNTSAATTAAATTGASTSAATTGSTSSDATSSTGTM